MICENCNENEATIHYTEIINGVRNEHHICSECARKMDFTGYSNMTDKEFPFVKLLTGLLASANVAKGLSESPMMHVICPGCKMSFDEFTMVGKFGCPECYNVFGPLIDDNMKRIHGDSVHKGKKYISHDGRDNTENGSEEKDVLDILAEHNAALKEAVELENFEEAARLRDLIRDIKDNNHIKRND